MGRKWEKFRLLMWKNYLLQFRRPLQTTLEILAPVFFCILLLIIRSLVDPQIHKSITYQSYIPFPYMQSGNDSTVNEFLANSEFQDLLQHYSILYTPKNHSVLNDCMKKFEIIFKEVRGFDTGKELESYYLGLNSNATFAGVEFKVTNQTHIDEKMQVALRFPGRLRVSFAAQMAKLKNKKTSEVNDAEEGLAGKFFKIFEHRNWRTYNIWPWFQTSGPREPEARTGGQPSYYAEGFLALQTMLTFVLATRNIHDYNISNIFDTFITHHRKIPIITMQRFPHAQWVRDPLLPGLMRFESVMTLLSFVYTCINTVKVITTEKENQLKESMKIMGLPNWLHWTAWFIKQFLFLSLSVILIVILLKVSWFPASNFSVFTYANPVIMILFFAIYACATITFCFVISVFFSSSSTAATVAGLLWFISYAPYMFLQHKYEQLPLAVKLITSLGSNTAMAFGCQIMLTFEGSQEGIQWDNVWRPTNQDDSLCLGYVLLMLLFDTFLYLFVALYVEQVFPGEIGVPQPFYFFLSPKYWRGTKKNDIRKFDNTDNVPSGMNRFFESEPDDDFRCGIEIRHLRKVYHKKVAVNDLCLNIYENQITVLLGHNGAGKTTTISMLIGMFPPTSGTAVISGFDIGTSMDMVRASLGICPQVNILFDDLTVAEHLRFFGRLKGLHESQIQAETDSYLTALELTDKKHCRAAKLSGGMKRKLCVAMAFCGDSRVVILDEPSAGMDPGARHCMWNFLQREKNHRTVLITTHFMDEADVLGDRIAIMAAGDLQCCGSSFFLKKHYGGGYKLIIDKSPTCQSKNVKDLLQRHIPAVDISSDVGSELTFILGEKYSHFFKDMLSDLETQKENLGIMGYGISLATLEEVFMKVGADSVVNPKEKSVRSSSSLNKMSKETKKFIYLKGMALISNQLLAMLMKKGLSMMRSWVLTLIQNTIMIVFLVITLLINRTMRTSEDLPELDITLDCYERPMSLIEFHDNNQYYVDLYKMALAKHEWLMVANITETMLNYTQVDPMSVRNHYLTGVSINGSTIVNVNAWFNNDPYHTPPLTLQLALNLPYKQLLGNNHSISFINKPFPYTAEAKVDKLSSQHTTGFRLAFNMSFAMAFVSSFYVLFPVKERVSKSKHLQFISGARFYVFWAVSYLCDMAHFMLTVAVICLTLLPFDNDGFNRMEDFCRLCLLLFCFGFSVIPMLYLTSSFFDVPATGFTRMTLFSVFTGVTAFVVVFLLKSPGLQLDDSAEMMHWIFLIIPHYSLASGINDMFMTFGTHKMCMQYIQHCQRFFGYGIDKCWDIACNGMANMTIETLTQYCCAREPDYFKWDRPGIGRNLIFTLTGGVAMFSILLLLDSKILSKIPFDRCRKQRKPQPIPVSEEDSDVHLEKLKIRKATNLQQLQSDHTLILKDVTKYYRKFLAVNGVCLAVKQFECFGLLGVNGAGKTTTFKILTGDVKMTWGQAWVRGRSIRTEFEDVQKLIGYCPQFDALLDNLTAKETLIIYALIRGIPLKDCRTLPEKLARDFDFTKHLNKKVKQLSGGNKRKLSTAVSLIGDPVIIYLDEPTTGMDPATKRYFWDVLCSVRDSGKCVILTSHSMEECEALCTRLAIMVNGNFKCLGSTQHLKNKFARGYTLTVKIKRASKQLTQVCKFVEEHFPEAVLKRKHQQLLTFHLGDTGVFLADMFGVLETGKVELDIEDYSLGQSSLEQVFLNFAQQQV